MPVSDLTNREVPMRLSLNTYSSSPMRRRTAPWIGGAVLIPAEHTRELAERIDGQWCALRSGVADAVREQALASMGDFITAARSDADLIRRNLGEVLMAQGYQDLSGQIIRSVMQLIDEIQNALAGLVALSQGQTVDYERRADNSRGPAGPRIPGKTGNSHVDGQDEVDRLLSGLDL